MNKLVAVLVGFLVVGLVVGVSLFSVGVGTYNQCVSSEQGIKAQYDENRNNYDNFWKRVKEVAQVPAMYTEDLKKLYDGAITGRYGKDGSKALFQFLKEQNPTLDASMYRQIQEVIESGRISFEVSQKTLIDKKRVYETYIQSFPTNVIVRVLGFPKIDLAKYDIVTSEQTEKAFDTKKSDELKVR